MEPKLMHGPWTDAELEEIARQQKKEEYMAKYQRDTVVMVKVSQMPPQPIKGREQGVWLIEYADGTAYQIDQDTAQGLEDMTRAYLKTRMN